MPKSERQLVRLPHGLAYQGGENNDTHSGDYELLQFAKNKKLIYQYCGHLFFSSTNGFSA